MAALGPTHGSGGSDILENLRRHVEVDCFQIAQGHPGAGEGGDPQTWIHSWAEYIEALGIDSLGEDADEVAQASWVELVMEKFALRGVLQHHMDRAIADMEGEER